jgi:beta-lactamase class A
VGRSIHYEYGGGVEERGRLSWVFWTIICVILFAVSAAAPRALQHYGLIYKAPAEQVSRAAETAPAVVLQQSAPQPDKELATTSPVDAGLQTLISEWAARNSNQTWGVSVERLGDEPVIAQYQPTQRFYPASLYKLLITQSLSEKVSADQWATRTIYDHRGNHTYAECVDLMIRISDNACGEAIGNFLNWKNIDGRLGAIGLENTKLNSDESRFTAADMSKYMRLMHDEPILSRQAKTYVMESLKNQKFRNGIPAGTPNCTVYNKYGDLNGYRHDVALVECGEAVYSLAIMSKGGSYKQIADLAKVINNYLVAQ